MLFVVPFRGGARGGGEGGSVSGLSGCNSVLVQQAGPYIGTQSGEPVLSGYSKNETECRSPLSVGTLRRTDKGR